MNVWKATILKLFVYGLGNYTQIPVFVITENALSTDYTDGVSSPRPTSLRMSRTPY